MAGINIKSRANILTRVQSKAYTEPSSFSSLFNLPYSKDIHYFSQAGFAEKPPNLTRHYFTCNIIFTNFFSNPPNFTCHIAKFYPILFPECVFFCRFKIIKKTFKIKRLFLGKSAYYK